MKITRVGFDIAKEVFEVHGVNEHGKVEVRKQLGRARVLEFFANFEACLIGMETGSGAHYWARELSKLGHTVKLMAPRFVKPYRKNDKSDENDAEAICEAVGRPDPLSLWVQRLRARSGDNVAAVALAAKNARMVWAMLARDEDYRPAMSAAQGTQA